MSLRKNWRKELPVTPKMIQVYNFVRDFTAQHHYPPCYEDIRSHIGVASKSNAARYVAILQDKGYLKMDKGVGRSIVIIKEPDW